MGRKLLEATRGRVEACVAVVEARLGIAELGYVVHHRFMESIAGEDDDSRIVAETVADWEYRQARIKWYLPVIAGLDDDELLADAVHEYVHVLTASMESEIHAKHAKQCEFAVESIARVLLRALGV